MWPRGSKERVQERDGRKVLEAISTKGIDEENGRIGEKIEGWKMKVEVKDRRRWMDTKKKMDEGKG